KGEGHIARRGNVLKEALSPADPKQGLRVRRIFEGGTSYDVDVKNLPLFHREGLCANYDEAKGQALIERAYQGDTEADAALSELIFQHLIRASRSGRVPHEPQ